MAPQWEMMMKEGRKRERYTAGKDIRKLKEWDRDKESKVIGHEEREYVWEMCVSDRHTSFPSSTLSFLSGDKCFLLLFSFPSFLNEDDDDIMSHQHQNLVIQKQQEQERMSNRPESLPCCFTPVSLLTSILRNRSLFPTDPGIYFVFRNSLLFSFVPRCSLISIEKLPRDESVQSVLHSNP